MPEGRSTIAFGVAILAAPGLGYLAFLVAIESAFSPGNRAYEIAFAMVAAAWLAILAGLVLAPVRGDAGPTRRGRILRIVLGGTVRGILAGAALGALLAGACVLTR